MGQFFVTVFKQGQSKAKGTSFCKQGFSSHFHLTAEKCAYTDIMGCGSFQFLVALAAVLK